jgi:hypothetical protein
MLPLQRRRPVQPVPGEQGRESIGVATSVQWCTAIEFPQEVGRFDGTKDGL